MSKIFIDTTKLLQFANLVSEFISTKISELQTAIKAKADSSHTHNYAGSSSVGGSANSAVKLDTSAGSATQPVYFKDGKPVAITHTLGKSVPADAVFTDTVYTHPNSEVAAGTYERVTVDSQGHVTSGDNPTYVHAANGTQGTPGYVKIATLKVSGTYQNSPLVIELSRRRASATCTLYLSFYADSSTDPPLGMFYYIGNNYACYMHKSDTSTWDLYVKKSEDYDNIGVLRYHKPAYMSGVSVTWTNVLADSVPDGAVAATLGGTVANASKATTLATARTLTIGNTGKSFNGSASVAWTLDEIGAAIKPTVLYSNDSGDNTSETITLSDTVTNYTRIEIIYGLNWNTTNVAVSIPSLSKRVAMSVTYAGNDFLSITTAACLLKDNTLIRGTTLDNEYSETANRERRIMHNYATTGTIKITSTIYTAEDGFGIYIYRVIGYKD